MTPEKIIVLDYYLVDGQYCHDVSLLRKKAVLGSGGIKYVAQVQIVTSIAAAQTTHSARTIISDFAIESASSIADLFESVIEDQHSDRDHTDVQEVHEGTKNG